MRDIRNSRDLKGLWAAMPTPWNDRGRFVAGVLERNVERYAAIPMDGVYITDSDGAPLMHSAISTTSTVPILTPTNCSGWDSAIRQ